MNADRGRHSIRSVSPAQLSVVGVVVTNIEGHDADCDRRRNGYVDVVCSISKLKGEFCKGHGRCK